MVWYCIGGFFVFQIYRYNLYDFFFNVWLFKFSFSCDLFDCKFFSDELLFINFFMSVIEV